VVARRDYDNVTAQHKTATATREQTAARKAALQAKRRQMLAKIAQADADLKHAQVALSYATLVAPRAGVVTTRSAEVGMMAIPGTPLLTLDSEDYVLEATLRESDAAKVRIGQRGKVRIDALQQTLSGMVSEILPARLSLSRTMTVKMSLPATSGLRSGLYGKSQFVVGQRTGLLVPATALVERGQLQSVFIVDAHQRGHMRLVTTGKTINDGVEILSGVDAGERVVVHGADALADGMRVAEERVS
jgi:RND family efflux transporter MFP subunit